jgi:hypothetical protein
MFMAKFIYKIFIFLVVLKICDILLSSFFFWSLETQTALTEDVGSLNRMYHGEINAEVVFFGSSRTSLHINPEVVQAVSDQTVWNLGMDGSNFEQQEFTLEEYLLHNKTPKIVVFEADLVSLDPSLLRFKTELFLPYRNDSNHTFNLFNSSWDESLYYWFFSSTVYKPQIPAILMDYQNIVERIKNGGNIYEPTKKPKVLTVNRPDYLLVNGAQMKKGQVPGQIPQTLPYPSPIIHFDLTNINNREENFQKLTQFANDRGYTLVLMFPPYMNGEIDESQRKIAVDFYTKLTQKYKNIYFLDYSQDSLLSNNPNYWWDKNHLNIKGAKILSEEIGLALNQILKKNN